MAVKVRLTPTEFEELREAAEKVGGYSVGAYVGAIAQEAARDMPMRQYDTIGPLIDARREIRRTGNNLNQIAKALNSNRQPTPRRLNRALEDSSEALRITMDAVDELGRAWSEMVPKAVKKRVRSRWWEDKPANKAEKKAQEKLEEDTLADIVDG